jgi:hypothetical protein
MVSHWPVPAERRVKLRYPLDLSVRFRYPHAGSLSWGAGLTVNVSSGGALVASKHRINVGVLVEMSIEWPSRLDGKVSLQLIAVGRVVRKAPSQFAVSFERHEFRTMKSDTTAC